MIGAMIAVVDDSTLARLKLIQALPASWRTAVAQAANGEEAMELCRRGGIDLMFLDLTMPVMDGYAVLERLRAEGLQTRVIVVSADIQPLALERVEQLGALEFVQKPLDPARLADILQRHAPRQWFTDLQRDAMQEVVNVAVGQAGGSLARMLGRFVKFTAPRIEILRIDEVARKVGDLVGSTVVTAVRQAFIGELEGEALLLLSNPCFRELAAILDYEEEVDPAAERELALEVGNLLLGACMCGVAEQLKVELGFTPPSIVAEGVCVSPTLFPRVQDCSHALLVEILLSLEKSEFRCHLLVLMTHDAVSSLNQRLESYIQTALTQC